jgi:hypothetical protein
MSRFYAVELRTIAIVQVEDEQNATDAEWLAEEHERDIFRDASGTSIEFDCVGEVKSVDDLNLHGWEGECIPYGGDGNTRLKDLLPATVTRIETPRGVSSNAAGSAGTRGDVQENGNAA